MTDPWQAVPRREQAIVRSFLNSDQEADKERALAYCQEYGLDYAEMRKVILVEMVAEQARLAARREEKERLF